VGLVNWAWAQFYFLFLSFLLIFFILSTPKDLLLAPKVSSFDQFAPWSVLLTKLTRAAYVDFFFTF
jgi:hypothetical protein